MLAGMSVGTALRPGGSEADTNRLSTQEELGDVRRRRVRLGHAGAQVADVRVTMVIPLIAAAASLHRKTSG